jgi:hypothetical protein
MVQDGMLSEAMLQEEERMQKASEKAQAARDKKMELARRKDVDAGAEAVDKKFKALERLLNQSKVCRIAFYSGIFTPNPPTGPNHCIALFYNYACEYETRGGPRSCKRRKGAETGPEARREGRTGC